MSAVQKRSARALGNAGCSDAKRRSGFCHVCFKLFVSSGSSQLKNAFGLSSNMSHIIMRVATFCGTMPPV